MKGLDLEKKVSQGLSFMAKTSEELSTASCRISRTWRCQTTDRGLTAPTDQLTTRPAQFTMGVIPGPGGTEGQ